MIRETVPFTTREAWLASREVDLTSTSIAALLGHSPYMTPFELFHWKRNGLKPAFVDNEAVKWGRRFEASIAEELAERHGWVIRPKKDYMRLPEHCIGSSFDYEILNLGVPTLLEVKNAGWRQLNDEGWIETDAGYEAPSYIEYQCQTELLVSGYERLIIGACIGGNEERIIERALYQDVADEIIEAARLFWSSTEPPAPDYYRDGDVIGRLNAYAEPDKVITADQRVQELLAEYADYSRQAKIAEEHKDARKAEILELIGDAEKVLAPGLGSLSAGMVAPTRVEAYDRKGYRNFRFNQARKTKA